MLALLDTILGDGKGDADPRMLESLWQAALATREYLLAEIEEEHQRKKEMS